MATTEKMPSFTEQQGTDLPFPLTSTAISALLTSTLSAYSSPPPPPLRLPPPSSPGSSQTMDGYLSSLALARHETTVVARQGMPASPSLYFWTYRPTNSDVLSVINTTVVRVSEGRGVNKNGVRLHGCTKRESLSSFSFFLLFHFFCFFFFSLLRLMISFLSCLPLFLTFSSPSFLVPSLS